MKRALVVVMLCACGAGVDAKKFENAPVSGCGDFFVVFLASDGRSAVTAQVDRKAAGVGAGTTTVDASKVTLHLDTFSRALNNAGEHYCTDLPGNVSATTQTVSASSVKVTIDHLPASAGEAYPMSIELKDVDLGAGATVGTLSGAGVSVGWFAG